jgi:hypothetical protein
MSWGPQKETLIFRPGDDLQAAPPNVARDLTPHYRPKDDVLNSQLLIVV